MIQRVIIKKNINVVNRKIRLNTNGDKVKTDQKWSHTSKRVWLRKFWLWESIEIYKLQILILWVHKYQEFLGQFFGVWILVNFLEFSGIVIETGIGISITGTWFCRIFTPIVYFKFLSNRMVLSKRNDQKSTLHHATKFSNFSRNSKKLSI